MFELWLVLPVAMLAHEGAHYLHLRRLGIHPRLRFGVMALGWSFDPGTATSAQLRRMWLAGPLAEAVVWTSAAVLLRGWAIPCLIVMGVQLLSNLILPGTDGWRVGHSLRRVPARVGLPSRAGATARVRPAH